MTSHVALIGLGTVGTGVARLLLDFPERIRRRSGRDVALKHVVVRDLQKARDVALPNGVLTDDIDRVVDDEEVKVAVELIGGTTTAFDWTARLLKAGKHVVTANKALIAAHGDELFALAREYGCTIAFEAAVAGGIPIIANVGQSMAGNQVVAIEAILNGTSNFILSQMGSSGRSYADVLKEAQELGYAEADPSMDVDGTDAAQKLIILARLAFGTKVSLDSFPRQGIDTLESADLLFADQLGYAIKLLAVARLVRRETEPQLEMHVQPTLVRQGRPIAQTSGAFNIVSLECDAVGRLWLSGAGAGQMETASAVVADLIDTVAGRTAITFPRLDLWNEQPPLPLQPAGEMEHRYYLRFNVEDRLHVFADIADILGRNGISLASIIQREAPEPDRTTADSTPIVPLVVMTHRTTRGCIQAASKELMALSSLQPGWISLPVAD